MRQRAYRAEAESWESGTLGRKKQKELRAKGSKVAR